MSNLDQHVNASGYLDAGDGHSIYWEDWGNPSSTPILHLHGGPGAEFSEKHKILYDPSKHRVIFHDQRGSGKSRPLGELQNNTTQYLIDDIERLRQHLQIEVAHVSGGSWGACLALLYAIANPSRIKRLMLWSTYLGRRIETDHMYQGFAKYYLPEAWERFIERVPEDKRSSAQAVMQFYFDKINSPDQLVAQQYSDEWALWDTSLVVPGSDWESLKQRVPGDSDNQVMAKFSLYYSLNSCFIPESFIFTSIKSIQEIPCDVVQGRFDFCTPAMSAYQLSEAYGEKLNLTIVNSGHLRTDPEMLKALQVTAVQKLI